MKLVQQVARMYQLLDDNRIEKLGLFDIANGAIVTPLMDDALSFFTHRSKRTDEFIDQSIIEELVVTVKAEGTYRGVNHIGFCYSVDSKANEIKRITQAAGAKGLPVYQEPSTDEAAWLFVGDMSEITNPLLEFLPLEEPVDDKWVDYWLPHIQFDIDTALSPDEIKAMVQKIINKPFMPYPIVIDGVTYIQRVNLGCVQGVNIMLDIATNNRNPNYRKSWTKLD